MITFKNIAGNRFLAVGTIQRKSALNGEKSLTGTLYDGKDVLNKIDKGWSLEFDGEPYVVTYFERNDNDNSVSFDAIHKFFWDMAKKVLYSSTEISGSHTIKWYLDQIFANTGYTYALNFSPAAIEKDNWGNKTRLSLFNDLITSIAGEFEINGTLISIFQNIGTDLSTIVRYGFNLSDMTLENDATSFVTYGEGFGAYADQENQTGERVHVTYTSPLAGVYGILQAEPIDDQRYTSQANLQAAVKAQVDASFSVSVQLSLYDLTAAGYPYKMANVGDWLTAVDENLDFKQRIRIISIDDEFSADGTRISYTVTAGDVGLTKKYQDANASMSSQIANAVNSASQASTDANNALISANGKNTSYYLNSVDDLPTTANEGDLAWIKSGDGTVMYIYTKKADGSYYWEKRIDPEMGDQIASGVTEAVAQANAHTDEVKQVLSTDIDTARSQATSQASTAEANAKSEAASQFTQAQNALAEAKTNLQNDIDESKGNIVEINKTLTGFDGTLQRVQDAVNGLGQTNQLMNTEFTPDFEGWVRNDGFGIDKYTKVLNGSNVVSLSTTNDAYDYIWQYVPVKGGTVLSFSTYMHYTPTNPDGSTVFFRYQLVFYDDNNTALSEVFGTPNFQSLPWTLQKSENVTIPDTATSVRVTYYTRGVGYVAFSQPMLVFESTVGAYVQGNYNNNDALAQVKLTADKASLDLSTYTQDADGRISKAQAGVEANATAITQKVSKTDYDKKTGDLTQAVSKAQTTADSVVTTVGNYKTSNDKRVEAAESAISQNADAIALKVAKTDYDSNNSQLNTRFTKVEATANGAATTVSDLQQTVNNLGQVNQLFNTEFTPDYQSWTGYDTTFVNDVYTKTYKGSNVVAINSKDTGYHYLWQFVPVVAGTVISFSSYMHYNPTSPDNSTVFFRYQLVFYNDNNTSVGQVFGTANLQSLDWVLQKSENITVPTGATKVRVTFYSRGAGYAAIAQPMLVFASTIGTYVQGNYNNNAALAQVKITADSISNFVRDSSGNISSNFQTALSKTSIITGSTLATSIQKQTATQITSALTDNNGKIISLINQDTSGVQIAGKNIVLNGDTTVTGAFKVSQANIANGAIGTAQIGDAAITSAKIANLDVSKITGNVTNFIQSNWNGVYESTTITNDGMEIVTSDVTTNFGPYGIKLSEGGESVGGIGVSSYVGMPTNFQGIAFNLDGTGDYMTWGARESGVTTGNYTTKLAWFRSSYKPSGQNAGFNFSSDSPVTFWGSIYGRDNTEPLKIDSFGMNGISAGGIGHNNGNSAITFGGDGETYVISGGTYYRLAKLVKALQPLIGLGLWSVPKNIDSSGTVTKWTNVTT